MVINLQDTVDHNVQSIHNLQLLLKKAEQTTVSLEGQLRQVQQGHDKLKTELEASETQREAQVGQCVA